jgi:hypothetical protein
MSLYDVDSLSSVPSLSTAVLNAVAMSVISLFGYFLCCNALVLCLFSIAFVDSAVPYPSSNVPFPMHDFN